MNKPQTYTARILKNRQTKTFQVKFLLVCIVGIIFLLAPSAARASYTATMSGTTVTFTGDGNSDVLTLGEQGGLLTQSCYAKSDAGFNSAKDLDSSLPGDQTLSLTQVTKIIVNGGDGDNVVVINNPTGSVFAPNAVIWYDGQGGYDTLVLTGGGGADFRETYAPGPTKDAGVIETTNGLACQVINFSGLEPVQDNVPAATFTVNGNPANNAINYSKGAGGGIFVGNTGFVSVDNFETFEFNNKTNLTINGQAGDDTVNLNYHQRDSNRRKRWHHPGCTNRDRI